MSGELIVRKEIKINASTEAVWKALTDSEMTKQYMFGCELASDWQVGSELLWIAEGKVLVKGNITQIEPGKSLHYTTFDPNMGFEDKPDNYIPVTYNLSEEDGATVLSVTQGDFTGVEDAQKRFEDSVAGWDFTLEALRKLVEG